MLRVNSGSNEEDGGDDQMDATSADDDDDETELLLLSGPFVTAAVSSPTFGSTRTTLRPKSTSWAQAWWKATPRRRTGSATARNSSVPTAVDASSGVKTKCERGDTTMRSNLDASSVRAKA